MSETITVLLADDHAMVRRGAADFLATQLGIEVVAEASCAAEALAAVHDHAPDVALVDLVMPGTDGVALIADMARAAPGTAIVVLTSFAGDRLLYPALRAGALSYLLKDVSPGELVHAVRQAAAGQPVLHPAAASQVLAGVPASGCELAGPAAGLTTRELDVLQLVARGCSNAEIASDLFISQKTVKTHVSRILAKLQLADRTRAAAWAWRSGIVRP